MIWKDTHLSKKPALPRPVYVVISPILFMMAYWGINDFVFNMSTRDGIISGIVSVFLIFYGLCNAFMILKGGEYVERIEKKEDCFILTNIFRKKINFMASDIKSVEVSRFSVIDKFLTGFAKHIPGLDLILKDGSKYYITSDMENIESLKEHLLEKESIAYK
ncbi:hypothetical protein [Legionella micdadei]|uniref:Uncharacterized protein n=1 Tax=Legionella micdadei TaxID=451 RepID=A0A098GCZ3_LEGMI|nr:hypothetical protein [Legionella micdadei]KTD30326.1 hypothetical protein Lmic_0077 [Legionella micdadei]NSL18398.1 hypothetical protein [Legionella micdadei]CEG59847.1 protein of unknown function [Legionella micdadei]SCY51995.1 hypothetical protein SAMN02982997_01939 [Legionella micdadei]